jgi:capsular exopolysaccharide synthesis family protein
MREEYASPGPEGTGHDALTGAFMEEDERFDLRDILRTLRKHYRAFFGVLIVVFSAIAAYTFTREPVYTAETTLLIERQLPQVIDVDQELAESLGPDGDTYYNTQYQILMSRSVAEEVIRTVMEAGGGTARELWSLLGGGGAVPGGLIPPHMPDAYLRRFLVLPFKDSRVVALTFEAPHANLAANVVNVHASVYIGRVMALRTRPADEAREHLAASLVELEERVVESEHALQAYRSEHGIISFDDKENIVVERLGSLMTRLGQVEAERIAREAQMRLVRNGEYDALPEVRASASVERLRQDVSRLEAQYAFETANVKSERLLPRALGAQIEETKRKLEAEISRIVVSVRSRYDAILAEERALRRALDSQKSEAVARKATGVDYATLAREVETNRELHANVRQRIKELDMASQIRASNIFVIDAAHPPRFPSSPRVGLSLSIALALGLLGGLGLAFGLEFLDDRLKSPEEVERYLQLPQLGVVPDFGRVESGRVRSRLSLAASNTGAAISLRRNGAVVKDGRTAFAAAEAYRSIRTGLMLSKAEDPPRTILFTSALRGEGKTVTALNTALMFSQLGEPVALVDADLRLPTCHKLLNMDNERGLSDVLTHRGATELERRYEGTSLYLLSSGISPPNPSELFNSSRMEQVLHDLKQRHAYVVIDTPPIMAVSDALVLSRLVDGVVLVIDQEHTPRKMVRAARGRLAHVGAKVLGVVVNKVDPGTNPYSPYMDEYA